MKPFWFAISILLAAAPANAQGDPALIPGLVREAVIEGVRIGMTRQDAAAVLAVNGYEAVPRATGVGRGVTRDPCSLPGGQDTDRFATPVVRAASTSGGLRSSSSGDVLNPYASAMEVTFSCADQKVVRIARNSAAHWKDSVAVPKASEQRFFSDAADRYNTLCPAPAISDSKTDVRTVSGAASDLKTGIIRCGKNQSMLSAKYMKQEGDELFDYMVGLTAHPRNAKYSVEVSVQPAH